MDDVRTTQVTFHGRDVSVEERIALTLACTTCETLRTFIIDANLAMLLEYRWSAIKIEAQCSVCKRIVAVGLGWHPEEKGYSSKPVSAEGSPIVISDDAPLMPY